MANIIKRQPLFSGLSDLHTALDRLFDHNIFEWEKNLSNNELTHWSPRIDIKENENQFIIRADIPGVNPKDIDVNLENGLLTIKGKTELENKEEKENYVRVERSSGTFYRAINLPDVTDASKITAKSKNGVLEIIIPKTSKTISHKIQIKEE